MSHLNVNHHVTPSPLLQIDESLTPYCVNGPVATPPIPDYEIPDGEYNDTTKSYYVALPEGYKLKAR